MSLKGIAKTTLAYLEAGGFVTDDGVKVDFASEQAAAEAGTRLYRPEELAELAAQTSEATQDPSGDGPGIGGVPEITVTDETTQVAAHRLVRDEGVDDLVLLNFASARNPGGGFISGAKAQEEDLARCSGLYPCLLTQRDYYEINRAEASLLYTDHLIYSPKVPWFRTRSTNRLDHVFLASVITAPAPNAGETLRRDAASGPQIEATLRRRAAYVLALARDQKHRRLLLGAWGCGVFRNDPAMVADAFGAHLESPDFAGAFNAVTFAVLDRSKQKATLQTFRERFP